MSSAHKVSAAGCFSSSLLGGGRGVCVRAKAAEAKPSSSKAGSWQELEDWMLKSQGSGGTLVASTAVQNSQSEGRWVKDRVWKLQSLYYHRISWSIKWTWQELISNTTAGLFHCPHSFVLVSSIYHNIKNVGRQKKFYTKNKSAVAGVGTAVTGFSTISCFAFYFAKNITWGGEERKPEMFQSVTFQVTGLLWMASLKCFALYFVSTLWWSPNPSWKTWTSPFNM